MGCAACYGGVTGAGCGEIDGCINMNQCMTETDMLPPPRGFEKYEYFFPVQNVVE